MEHKSEVDRIKEQSFGAKLKEKCVYDNYAIRYI